MAFKNKQPRSAFEIFCDNERRALEDRYPDAKSAYIEKMLNSAWDGLTLRDRNYYFNLSRSEIDSCDDDYF